MEFTLLFVRVFITDLIYASPLLLFHIVLISGIGFTIGKIEGWSTMDAFYHAFINATTVGYGDFRPIQKRSKLLAIVLAFVGLIFTGMMVAIALHAATDAFAMIYQLSGFTHKLAD